MFPRTGEACLEIMVITLFTPKLEAVLKMKFIDW